MATKRFQVPSEGERLQAVVDLPGGDAPCPIVIASHAALRESDGAFFEGLVEPLVTRGIGLCRYDPRGYAGAAAAPGFWSRWVDLTAVTQHLQREFHVAHLGLAGAGPGAALSLWWAAVHPVRAVVCFSLPSPGKLGPVPRAMHDRLPVGTGEDDVIPHPAGVAGLLLVYGEKDRDAGHAFETAGALGAQVEIARGADRTFSRPKTRPMAFQSAAAWLARHLLEAGAGLPEEPAQEHGEGREHDGVEQREGREAGADAHRPPGSL